MNVLIVGYSGTVEGFQKYLADFLIPAAEDELLFGSLAKFAVKNCK